MSKHPGEHLLTIPQLGQLYVYVFFFISFPFSIVSTRCGNAARNTPKSLRQRDSAGCGARLRYEDSADALGVGEGD
jgi:hypothetical protein